jgi:hypothetical protein
MLMPEVGWPPEIDFNETRQSDGNTIATLHYTSADLQIYRSLNIDLAQWHTWGVVWTPTSLTYTVDGQAWGIIDSASEIPDQPMHLDITQQTWCSSGFACPTAPESTQVDWVEEYKPTIGESAALGPFAPNSWALTPVLKAKIVKLAVKIKVQGDNSVALVGYNDDSGTAAKGIAISKESKSCSLDHVSTLNRVGASFDQRNRNGAPASAAKCWNSIPSAERVIRSCFLLVCVGWISE